MHFKMSYAWIFFQFLMMNLGGFFSLSLSLADKSLRSGLEEMRRLFKRIHSQPQASQAYEAEKLSGLKSYDVGLKIDGLF